VKLRLHIVLPLVILLAGLYLRVVDTPILAEMRLKVFDTMLRLQPREYDPDLPVRIVDIDNESLERLGQWPWPRTLVAELVLRLTEAGAAVIAFDAVFAEPDRTSPSEIVKIWPETEVLAELRDRIDELPDHDDVLANAIARSNVVTGFALSDAGGAIPPERKAGFAFAGPDPTAFIPHFTGAIVNLPLIEALAAGNGSFNALPDRDGIYRRVPLLVRMGDVVYPSLAAEALRVVQPGATTYVVKSAGASGEEDFGAQTGISVVRIGEFLAPTQPDGRVWVHYAGSRPERYVHAWRLFEEDFDPEVVAGRIIFIGASAPGLVDLRATPLNPIAPGVEVHAEVVEQILAAALRPDGGTGGEPQPGFLVRDDIADGVELIYLALLGALTVWLIPMVGARWSGLLGVGTVAFAFGVSWYMFTAQNRLFDPVYPSLVVLAVYLVATGIIFFRTEGERRWVRNAFSRYLSPAVVDQLADDPHRLALGGEMRDMTVLFCDIQGFTRISEGYDAEGLTRFLNGFLTPMTDVLLAHGATIDKYMGDAIMAFWNAPVMEPGHARRGCEAALAMATRLADLNRRWAEEARAEGRSPVPVRIGLGLNTGRCCVGNLGSDQRFDYSVIGDEVNLASRLEGQTRVYGVPAILGEETAVGAGGLALIELDLLRVKGKTETSRAYALLGGAEMAADSGFRAFAESHGAMLAAYRAGDWDRAEALLAECRKAAPVPLETLYDLYAARIAGFRATPPPPDWDGVHISLEK
jgi:adenylate cyclase